MKKDEDFYLNIYQRNSTLNSEHSPQLTPSFISSGPLNPLSSGVEDSTRFESLPIVDQSPSPSFLKRRRQVMASSPKVWAIIVALGIVFLFLFGHRKLTRIELMNVGLEGEEREMGKENNMVLQEDETASAVEDAWTAANKDCDAIDWNNFIDNYKLREIQSPQAFLAIGGKIMSQKIVEIGTPGTACVIVALPKIKETPENWPYAKVAGMPADSVMVVARSPHVIYPMDTMPVNEHDTIFSASGLFLDVGDYTFEIDIEYRNYAWNAEPDTSPVPNYTPERVSLPTVLRASPAISSPDIKLPERPICRAGSNLSGRWIKKERYREQYPNDFWGIATNWGGPLRNTDEYGFVFKPDRCTLEYFTPHGAFECFKGRTLHVYGDSNSRRFLKALSSGNTWCESGGLCDCDDTHEDDVDDTRGWARNPDIPLSLGMQHQVEEAGQAYFHFLGGLLHQVTPWPGLFMTDPPRSQILPNADLVLIGTGNWDTAFTRFENYDGILGQFFASVRKSYPDTPIILRMPQPFCCTSVPQRYWTRMRVDQFKELILQRAKEFNVTVWDVSVLGRRKDLYDSTTCDNRGNHARASIIRMENQLLFNTVCGSSRSKFF
ncbi:uncharacterized protein VTP21DRAFT_61 [Calcarisporiella thermophila]|uniref:uncharacterized protein n=1 Tax=Calcarisporiella thermophila TaxID=911321 RepID=UPI0037446C16